MQLWNYTNLTNENKPFIKCNFIGKNGHSLLNMPLAPVSINRSWHLSFALCVRV